MSDKVSHQSPIYQKKLIENIFANAPTKLANNNIDADYEGKTQDHKSALLVYHNNYIENGIRALSISFPTVYGIMEEADFRRLCRMYLLKHPKTCFDWADYGKKFAEFMFDIEALAQTPYLPELAQLDWYLMHIERAVDFDFDPQSFNLLQAQPPESLFFKGAPGLKVMQALFPLVELYALVHDKNLSQDSDARAAHLEITNKLINDAINTPHHRSFILWREHYKALFEYTDETSCEAFKAMLNGESIASVLAVFADNEAQMSQWLETHISSRKIYAVST